MKSVCAFEVVTQYEIVVNGRRYFADIAIPGLMIIFEFDGIGKLGKNEADFAQAKREWIQRENESAQRWLDDLSGVLAGL